MERQGRVCINCRSYDTETNECALHPKREPLVNSKTHWCMEGKWARYDEQNSRWQIVTMLDDMIDMQKPLEEPPIGRPIDTTMITVSAGKTVTTDGQVIEKPVLEEGLIKG